MDNANRNEGSQVCLMRVTMNEKVELDDDETKYKNKKKYTMGVC